MPQYEMSLKPSTSYVSSIECKERAEYDTDEETRDCLRNDDESQKSSCSTKETASVEIHADSKPENSSGRSEKCYRFQYLLMSYYAFHSILFSEEDGIHPFLRFFNDVPYPFTEGVPK